MQFRTFIDFTESMIPRAEIRYMEKTIHKHPNFAGRDGKIYYFGFKTDIERLLFIQSIRTWLLKLGQLNHLANIDDPWFNNKNYLKDVKTRK